MNPNFKQLQSELNITFQNQHLLRQAFTHSSFVNEHRTMNSKNEHRMSHLKDNERMEFLGDAVLELAVSDYLFHVYPERTEGELTKLRASIVCEPSLFKVAQDLQFGTYVLLGKGEEMTGGRSRPALLADVFESFVGALYLDQGMHTVTQFLRKHVFPRIADLQMVDFKTQLQEYTQHHNMGTLEYRVVDEKGPAHEKQFVSEVYMDNQLLGRGIGRSKKESEQQAAAKAIAKLEPMQRQKMRS